jgi:hypothetical protein
MVVLGYDFVTLDDAQKKSRRHLLELYPFVAQVSVLAVFALIQLCFFLSWISRRGLDYERPRSPSFTKRSDGNWTWLRKSLQGWDKMMWWMKKPVIDNWGTRGEWLGGGIWTVWLLYLCIVNTGNGVSNCYMAWISLILCRLPSPHQTFWHHWGISNAATLSPRDEVSILTYSMAHSSVP